MTFNATISQARSILKAEAVRLTKVHHNLALTAKRLDRVEAACVRAEAAFEIASNGSA